MMILLTVCASLGNGLSLNSPGPKGLGMGGAIIGLADDYTAVYWNPAGVVQLKGPQIGAFVTDVIPMASYKMKELGIDTKTKFNNYISPAIMGYIPLMSNDLSIGLGVYVPSGIGAEWDGNDLKLLSGSRAFDWKSKVGVFHFAPVVAYRFSDMLSAGAALNISYGMFDMKRPMGSGQTLGQYDESSTGTGFGGSLGLLFRPADIISLGLSFKTENKIKFSGDANYSALAAAGAASSEFDRDLAWPMWFGGGIAFRPYFGLVITADAQWSNWSATQNEIVTNYKNAVWQQMIVAPGENKIEMKWKDAVQIRFGAQYEFTNDLTLRIGYYNDPAPAPDETLNILFPSITYTGFTFGGTYKMGVIDIDFGAEYLIGAEREITLAYAQSHPDAMPGIHNNNILALSLGLSLSLY